MITYRTTANGRGVFAERDIAAGEVIERVPVIVIVEREVPHIDACLLDSYAYHWCDKGLAIALGLGSVYNHSYQPNARYIKHFESSEMEYVALDAIEAGCEICINYNGDPADQSPVIFMGERWRHESE